MIKVINFNYKLFKKNWQEEIITNIYVTNEHFIIVSCMI
jgi:hypothetical protein